MIARMRNLTEQHKIPGRSIPEIVSRFNGLVTHQQTMIGRKFRKRKVPAEVLTNAIVLHFLDLSASDQEAILNKYVSQIESFLDVDSDNENTDAAIG